MKKTVHGFVHGKMIELSEDLGIADGQAVVVEVSLAEVERPWGDGILRTSGALAEESEWDQIMDEIHQNRY